jgi:uncharacterized membrane protein YvbJ
MAYCSNCGTQNTDDKKFCLKCGNPMMPKIPNQQVNTPTVNQFANPQKRNIVIIGIVAILIALTGFLFWYFSKSKSEIQTTNEVVTTVDTTQVVPQPNNDQNTTTVQSQQTETVSNTTQFQPGYYIANGNETNKIYFHNAPDQATRRKAYLSTQETVYVQKVQNNFGYIEFTNSNGQSSFGWVEMQFLIVKPN